MTNPPKPPQTGRELTKSERRKALRALYSQLPTVKCKGLCSGCCGPIQASDLEYDIIEQRAGKKLTTDKTLTCTMLSPNGRCTVYGDRPMLCRIWGATPKLPCPHGCEVQGSITDDEAMALLMSAFIIGGGRRADVHAPPGGLPEAIRNLKTPRIAREVDQLLARGRAGDRRKLGVDR